MDKTIQINSHSSAETVIGPSTTIQGELTSDGDINVAGQVSGKITTNQSLLVISGGKILAEVSAGTAIIDGDVQGKLTTSGLLVLQSTAKVTGDIACDILHVEDGAEFTGKCIMSNAAPTPSGKGKKSAAADLEPELHRTGASGNRA